MNYGFLNRLYAVEIGTKGGRSVYRLSKELIYIDKKGRRWVVPVGFETDLASVPRVPIIWLIWGDRAHREAVLHDFAYRIDAVCRMQDPMSGDWHDCPAPTREESDELFHEAIESDSESHPANPGYISNPMWAGVRLGGRSSYHRMKVNDRYELDVEFKEAA